MLFDVIVPTYNNQAELQACIEALQRQTLRDCRVLVCVDGSTDSTLEYLHGTDFSIEVLVLQHDDTSNHGRSAARNLALAHLQSRYVCLLDSDLVPQDEMLQRHAKLLEKRDCISLGDVRYTSADHNLWSAYSQSRGKNKFCDGRSIPYYYLATGNCAHRTELFTAVRGFDEEFHGYGGEDTDYGIRLHQHCALDVVFNERAVALSAMDKDLDFALQQLEDFGYGNLSLLHRKYPRELDMYFLGRMCGRSMTDRLMRLCLHPSLSQFVQDLAPTFPTPIAIRMLRYCVLSRMYFGFKRRTSLR